MSAGVESNFAGIVQANSLEGVLKNHSISFQ